MKDSGAFPDYMVNMVHNGEKSGKLEEVMAGLTVYYRREQSIRSSIQNVVSYPMMMFGMIVVILAVLTWKILPMFQEVLVNLHIDAKTSSGKIMSFGSHLGTAVVIISAVCILIGAGLWIWYQTEGGKKALKGFVSTFFLTKKTASLLAMGKLISSLSVMISSGMEPMESLEMAEGVVDQKGLRRKLRKCVRRMEDHESFSEALRKEKVLTQMQGRMVSVADKAGMLDDMLGDLSSQCDEQIEEQLSSLCAKIETTLVIFLSLIVGGVLLAVMFPMVSIITSIG